MEIITYICEDAITHEESLGNRGHTAAGNVSVMSAGSGIQHAEYNLESELTCLLQIQIIPNQQGQASSWDSKPFPNGDRAGQFVALVIGIPDNHDALPIRSDAQVLAATLRAGQTAHHAFSSSDRYGYLAPTTGKVELHGVCIAARDGAAIRAEHNLCVTTLKDAKLLLVDSAPMA